MISSTGLPINLKALSEAPGADSAGGEAGGADFLAALQQLERNGTLTPQALMGLLAKARGQDEGEAEALPEGLQALPELQDEIVGGDPAALLALMAAAGRGGVELPQQAQALAAAAQRQQQALMQVQADGAAELQSALGFESALQSAAKADAAAVKVPEFTVSTPVQQNGWGEALGERLVWSVREGLQQARIQLDPPHLGPLEIRINLQDDQASVQIQAHHAVTRDVVEAEIPRLRSMLADAGFSAVDVNVSQQQQQQREERAAAGAGGSSAAAGEVEEVDVSEHSTPLTGRGLVDHYV